MSAQENNSSGEKSKPCHYPESISLDRTGIGEQRSIASSGREFAEKPRTPHISVTYFSGGAYGTRFCFQRGVVDGPGDERDPGLDGAGGQRDEIGEDSGGVP